MKQFLDKIRTPIKSKDVKKNVINTILILILGMALGIFSKWLDDLALYDNIWWHRILGSIDLRNVLSDFPIWLFLAIAISVFSKTPLRASLNVLLFFLGMTVSYHLYTIYYSGFNPRRYMMIWYMITLFSPLLAYICWYAKSNNKISIVISSLILMVMLLTSFSIGFWYFDLKSIIDLIIFICTILVINKEYKNTIVSLILSFILTYTYRCFI